MQEQKQRDAGGNPALSGKPLPTQAKMAELFEAQKAAIPKHLKSIFLSGKLNEDSVVSILETTAAGGKQYQTKNCEKVRRGVC